MTSGEVQYLRESYAAAMTSQGEDIPFSSPRSKRRLSPSNGSQSPSRPRHRRLTSQADNSSEDESAEPSNSPLPPIAAGRRNKNKTTKKDGPSDKSFKKARFDALLAFLKERYGDDPVIREIQSIQNPKAGIPVLDMVKYALRIHELFQVKSPADDLGHASINSSKSHAQLIYTSLIDL